MVLKASVYIHKTQLIISAFQDIFCDNSLRQSNLAYSQHAKPTAGVTSAVAARWDDICRDPVLMGLSVSG